MMARCFQKKNVRFVSLSAFQTIFYHPSIWRGQNEIFTVLLGDLTRFCRSILLDLVVLVSYATKTICQIFEFSAILFQTLNNKRAAKTSKLPKSLYDGES